MANDHAHLSGYEVAHSSGLRERLNLLRKHFKGLVLWTSICMGCAIAYLDVTPPEYLANTQVVLEPRRSPAGVPDLAAATYGATLDNAQAESQIQVVKSEHTLRYVFDVLNLVSDPSFVRQAPGPFARLMTWLSTFAGQKPGPLGGLLDLLPTRAPAQRIEAEVQSTDRARAFQAFTDRVSVRRVGLSYVLEISFRAPSAVQAARLANAVTAAYIKDNISYGAAALRRGTELLQGRIADIQAEQELAADAVRTGLLPDASFPDSDVRVVSAALEPLGKAYPQTKLILLLATAFGLLSGTAFIILRGTLQRTVRSRQQLGRALQNKAFTIVPRFRHPAASRFGQHELTFTSVLDADSSTFAEALRRLRTSVLSSKEAHGPICVGVVSWSAGEGRSVIVSNLAMLIAGSQAKTLLIDAHFRNPRLSSVFAPNAVVGLDEVLLGHLGSMNQLVVPLGASLEFVPAVARGGAADPNVYIGSESTSRLLQVLRKDRHVLIDLPPMRDSSDTFAIAHLLDGVVLVVEANKTTLDDLMEASSALEMANVPVLSVVLNKLARGA